LCIINKNESVHGGGRKADGENRRRYSGRQGGEDLRSRQWRGDGKVDENLPRNCDWNTGELTVT